MKIYYNHSRFLKGNLYITTSSIIPSDAAHDNLVKAGMLTQEDIEQAVILIASSQTVGGAYPNVYVCTGIDNSYGECHYCINSSGKIILISMNKLYMHYPKTLYDGTQFTNNIVKGVFNEGYDYGFNHKSVHISNGFELTIDVDQIVLKTLDSKIFVDKINHIIALDKPFPKSTVSSDVLKKLNSLIHVLFNKRRYMLVEVADAYELLQV